MKNKKYSEKYVIVTGASLGLGKAIAKRFAMDGCNLILLSLPDEGLSSISNTLANQYGIKILHFETDLRNGENIREFVDWVLFKDLEIVGLVNNAGLGGSALFEKAEVALIDTMLLVNVRALTLLTRYFIPTLKEQKSSFIMNISSIAAFKPMPFKTVYPATKAFVYSFSVGLGEELKGTGVHVAVLHPGPMNTSEDNEERIGKHGFMGKGAWLTVDEVADIGVSQMLAGDKVIIPGVYNKVIIRLLKYIPRIFAMPLIYKVLKREILSDDGKQKV
ncbi:MAG TPA: SDR family NAD(P)-dependent oxidoreductase [Anditalea sp.]|nr:SDR family NAD(P)-dependent oxidoreductase [Anditalea sp.]